MGDSTWAAVTLCKSPTLFWTCRFGVSKPGDAKHLQKIRSGLWQKPDRNSMAGTHLELLTSLHDPVHTQSFKFLLLPWNFPTGEPAIPWYLFWSVKRFPTLGWKTQFLKLFEGSFRNSKVYPCCIKQRAGRVVEAWKLRAAWQLRDDKYYLDVFPSHSLNVCRQHPVSSHILLA